MIPSGSQISACSISPLRARARHRRRGQNPATAFQPIKAADLYSEASDYERGEGEVLGARERRRRARGFYGNRSSWPPCPPWIVREGRFPWKRSYLCARLASRKVIWSESGPFFQSVSENYKEGERERERRWRLRYKAIKKLTLASQTALARCCVRIEVQGVCESAWGTESASSPPQIRPRLWKCSIYICYIL